MAETAPGQQLDAAILLADFAQVDPGGKLHVIGAGWGITSPGNPHAVALVVTVPWNLTNQEHSIRLSLTGADGQPVTTPGPTGDPQPVVVENRLVVGRPAQAPIGTAFDVCLAVNVQPGLPLAPGQRYVWTAEIDGQTELHWQRSFSVVAGQAVPG